MIFCRFVVAVPPPWVKEGDCIRFFIYSLKAGEVSKSVIVKSKPYLDADALATAEKDAKRILAEIGLSAEFEYDEEAQLRRGQA